MYRCTNTTPDNIQIAATRITALWALSEAGLGGVLHAFHLPFKGLLIAGIAVVLLTLIAEFTNYSFKKILAATIAVLMVKAAVAPHSPPGAYIAVGFQGLMAAVFFGIFKSNKIAPILVGFFSLIETAGQKFIMVSLIFGKSFWQAGNQLLKEVAEDLHFDPKMNYAFWIVLIYLLGYGIWGALVGIFANRLPKKIEESKDDVLNFFTQNQTENLQPTVKRKNKKQKKIIAYILILAAIIGVFYFFGGGGKKILHVVLRTLAAVVFMWGIILPLIKFAARKWLGNRSRAQVERSEELLEMLPGMRKFLPVAFNYAKTQTSGFQRGAKFLVAMVVLALYGET